MKPVLRIAASAFFGLMTVALIVLWVRSYYWRDGAVWTTSQNSAVGMSTWPGAIHYLSRRDASAQSIPASLLVGFSQVTDRHAPVPPFRWRHSQRHSELILPIWFLTVFSASVSIVSWYYLPAQFGLRTLLIGTTVMALALGLICYAIE